MFISRYRVKIVKMLLFSLCFKFSIIYGSLSFKTYVDFSCGHWTLFSASFIKNSNMKTFVTDRINGEDILNSDRTVSSKKLKELGKNGDTS